MGPVESQIEVLKMVARRLDEAAIPYMVSGSVAMNFYAQPRMTRDIDIVVELAPTNAKRVQKLFSKDFYIDEQDVLEAAQERGLFNVIHNDSLVKVDFIIRKESDYRKEEFVRRRSIPLQDSIIAVAAPEDLLLSKLDWAKDSGSELQLKDARNLIDSVPTLDWDYLNRWAGQLGLSKLLSGLRGSRE